MHCDLDAEQFWSCLIACIASVMMKGKGVPAALPIPQIRKCDGLSLSAEL